MFPHTVILGKTSCNYMYLSLHCIRIMKVQSEVTYPNFSNPNMLVIQTYWAKPHPQFPATFIDGKLFFSWYKCVSYTPSVKRVVSGTIHETACLLENILSFLIASCSHEKRYRRSGNFRVKNNLREKFLCY